jgi:hypothetical protein
VQRLRRQGDALADFRVQVFEQRAAGGHRRRRAAQVELVAAGADAQLQALLDLAQVRVELAAECREVAGIIRFQG